MHKITQGILSKPNKHTSKPRYKHTQNHKYKIDTYTQNKTQLKKLHKEIIRTNTKNRNKKKKT